MNCNLRRGAFVVASLLAAVFSSSASAELIHVVANGQGGAQAILTFDSASPGTINGAAFIAGLAPGEAVVGIDSRPATGQVYALGSSSRLYTVNPMTGFAAGVAGPFGPPPLNGFGFGFDFNPTIDRVRVTSEVNQNLVLNPITGALQLNATPLAYGAGDPNFGVDPNVTASAYSNNFVGAATSQLYGIDAGLDILATQANNAGTLGTVGPLGVNVSELNGFDISGATGIAYAALQRTNSSISELYTINLATGAATLVGQIGGGLVINALTVGIPPIPEPATATLAVLALAGVAIRRRS